jgi:hypothetical protein
MNKNI